MIMKLHVFATKHKAEYLINSPPKPMASYETQELTNSKKLSCCSTLMKTGLDNVLLPTLSNVVHKIVQHC